MDFSLSIYAAKRFISSCNWDILTLHLFPSSALSNCLQIISKITSFIWTRSIFIFSFNLFLVYLLVLIFKSRIYKFIICKSLYLRIISILLGQDGFLVIWLIFICFVMMFLFVIVIFISCFWIGLVRWLFFAFRWLLFKRWIGCLGYCPCFYCPFLTLSWAFNSLK